MRAIVLLRFTTSEDAMIDRLERVPPCPHGTVLGCRTLDLRAAEAGGSNRATWLSLQGTKMGFATAGTCRKLLQLRRLQRREFSPGCRQSERVKNPSMKSGHEQNCNHRRPAVWAAILPFVVAGGLQLETPAFPNSAHLSTLTMYPGSIPVSNSRAFGNRGVEQSPTAKTVKGKPPLLERIVAGQYTGGATSR
jgi:hypothetical protein